MLVFLQLKYGKPRENARNYLSHNITKNDKMNTKIIKFYTLPQEDSALALFGIYDIRIVEQASKFQIFGKAFRPSVSGLPSRMRWLGGRRGTP